MYMVAVRTCRGEGGRRSEREREGAREWKRARGREGERARGLRKEENNTHNKTTPHPASYRHAHEGLPEDEPLPRHLLIFAPLPRPSPSSRFFEGIRQQHTIRVEAGGTGCSCAEGLTALSAAIAAAAGADHCCCCFSSVGKRSILQCSLRRRGLLLLLLLLLLGYGHSKLAAGWLGPAHAPLQHGRCEVSVASIDRQVQRREPRDVGKVWLVDVAGREGRKAVGRDRRGEGRRKKGGRTKRGVRQERTRSQAMPRGEVPSAQGGDKRGWMRRTCAPC
jgi:hypothetical protein